MIVVDLHPSYSALNQAIFEIADRILVPVTPDVPAIRAAVQLPTWRRSSGSASGWRCRQPRQQRRDRRGHGADGRDAVAGPDPLGGMLFVRAANEGRTVIEMFPREKITEDFEPLADAPRARPMAVAAREARASACSTARVGVSRGPPLAARTPAAWSAAGCARRGPSGDARTGRDPARAAQRRARQRLVALAGPPVDLLDAAQVDG